MVSLRLVGFAELVQFLMGEVSEPLQPMAAECAPCVLGCALDAPWGCPELFPGQSVQLVRIDYKINKCVKHPNYNYHDSHLSLSFPCLRSTNSN